jgi:hypothetical protein
MSAVGYLYVAALTISIGCGIVFLIVKGRFPQQAKLDRLLAFAIVGLLVAPFCLLLAGGVLILVPTPVRPPTELKATDVTSKGYLGLLPSPGSRYSQLTHHWSQGEDSPCQWLVTHFLDKDGNKVALLQETHCGSSYARFTRPDKPIPIKGIDSPAIPCDPNPGLYNESSYQTCLTWPIGKTTFAVYANLSEDECIAFVNGLVPEKGQ